jgi:DNA transformation protein
MANKREYLDFVLDWLAPLGGITSRAMFGGLAVYSEGLLFALVDDNVLYLKVDDETRPRFEALGLKAFQPNPNNPATMPYHPPPPEFFEDRDAMRDWGRAAIDAARRARSKKAPKRKARAR